MSDRLICSSCKQEGGLELFLPSDLKSKKMYSVCRNCRRKQNKEYRERDPERYTKVAQEYRNKNRIKVRTINKRYQDSEKGKATSQRIYLQKSRRSFSK